MSISSIFITSSSLLLINTLNSIIQGTTTSLNTIYNLLPTTTNEDKYIKEIKELDIELKLNIILNWLKKPENLENKSENFKLVYQGINNICLEISNTLDKINLEIVNHKLKYFSSYRTLNISYLIEAIEKQSITLSNRILLLHCC